MDNQPDLGAVAFTVILGFVLNGLVILLVRMVLQNTHERDIADVRHQQDLQLTQVRAELARAQMIQTTQFTDLHKRRAEVIADLYRLLAKADKHLRMPIVPVPLVEGHETSLWDRLWVSIRPKTEAVDNLADFYSENQIFLSPNQVHLMRQIIEILEGVKGSTMMRQLHIHYPPKDQDTKQFAEEFIEKRYSETQGAFAAIYPDLRTDLENDFRRTLGFEIE